MRQSLNCWGVKWIRPTLGFTLYHYNQNGGKRASIIPLQSKPTQCSTDSAEITLKLWMKLRAIKNLDKNAKGYLKYRLPEIYVCAFVRTCVIFCTIRVCNLVWNVEMTNYDNVMCWLHIFDNYVINLKVNETCFSSLPNMVLSLQVCIIISKIERSQLDSYLINPSPMAEIKKYIKNINRSWIYIKTSFFMSVF